MCVLGTLPPGFPWAKVEQEITGVYRQLVSLVPGRRLVVASKSGHYIQLEQPELVIDSIQQVVEAVHDPSTWVTAPATPVP